jgi:hypothetical protein
MLKHIQKLLATNEVMTQQHLANQLAISVDALAPMMQLLIRKGHVEQVISGDCTGGCGCVANKVIAYRWLGEHNQAKQLSVLMR